MYYLQNEKISVNQARILFKFRTRMSICWGNFKGGRPPQPCPLCEDDSSEDTQEHNFNCKMIRKHIREPGTYKDIFKDFIDEKTARTLEIINN